MLPVDRVGANDNGIITGRVTDAETGDPLPGAPVKLAGTEWGTLTDDDGLYLILNIRPGTYDLVVAFMGYRKKMVSEVRIVGGRPLTSDVALQPIMIESDSLIVMGRAVVFETKMEIPSTAVVITRQTLRDMPVTTIAEAIALDPAVEESGRIGRGDIASTVLIIDGEVMVDQQSSRPLLDNINTTSVQEIQVLVGGFTAEYGNGRAGAIIVTTRDAFQTYPRNRPFWLSTQTTYTPGHLSWFETPGPEPNGYSLAAVGSYTAYGVNSQDWRIYASPAALDSVVHFVTINNRPKQVLPWSIAENPRRYSPEDLQRIWMYQHRAGVDSLGGRQPGDVPAYISETTVGIPIHRTVGLVVGGRLTQAATAKPVTKPKSGRRGVNLKLNIRPLSYLSVDLKYNFAKRTGSTPASGGTNPRSKYSLHNASKTSANEESRSIWASYAPWSAAVLDVRASRLNVRTSRVTPYDDPIPDRYRLAVPGENTDGIFVDTVVVYRQGKTSRPFTLGETHWGKNLYRPARGAEPTGFAQDIYTLASSSRTSSMTSLASAFTIQLTPVHRLKVGGQRQIVSFGGTKTVPVTEWGRRSDAWVTGRITLDGMIADVGLRMDSWRGHPEPFTEIRPSGRVWSPRLGISHPIGVSSRLFFNYGYFYDIPEEIMNSSFLAAPLTQQWEVGADARLTNMAWLHVGGWRRYRTREFGETSVLYRELYEEGTYRFEDNKRRSDIFGLSVRAEWATRFFSGYFYHENYFASESYGSFTFIDRRPWPYYNSNPPLSEPSKAPIPAQTNIVLRWYTPVNFAAWSLSPKLVGGWALALLLDTTPADKIRWTPPDYELPANVSASEPNLEVRGRSVWHMRLEKTVILAGARVTSFLDVRNLFNNRLFNQGYFSRNEFDAYILSLHTHFEDREFQGPPRDGWATDLGGWTLPTGSDQVGDVPEYAVLPESDRWALWLDPRYLRWGLRLDF